MAKISEFVEALEILRKYDETFMDDYMSAEHDQIWFCENAEQLKKDMDPKDWLLLDSLGIFIDEDSDCFSMFT